MCVYVLFIYIYICAFNNNIHMLRIETHYLYILYLYALYILEPNWCFLHQKAHLPLIYCIFIISILYFPYNETKHLKMLGVCDV